MYLLLDPLPFELDHRTRAGAAILHLDTGLVERFRACVEYQGAPLKSVLNPTAPRMPVKRRYWFVE